MTDLSDLIPFHELPRRLPRTATGRTVHMATCYRWATRGVRGVRLSTIVIGGKRYVCPSDLEQFIAESTAAADAAPHPRRRSREQAIAAAERELDSAGI